MTTNAPHWVITSPPPFSPLPLLLWKNNCWWATQRGTVRSHGVRWVPILSLAERTRRTWKCKQEETEESRGKKRAADNGQLIPFNLGTKMWQSSAPAPCDWMRLGSKYLWNPNVRRHISDCRSTLNTISAPRHVLKITGSISWLPERSGGLTVRLFTVQMRVKNKGRLYLLESSRALLVIQVREHMSEAFVKAPASVAPAAIFASSLYVPFHPGSHTGAVEGCPRILRACHTTGHGPLCVVGGKVTEQQRGSESRVKSQTLTFGSWAGPRLAAAENQVTCAESERRVKLELSLGSVAGRHLKFRSSLPF